MLVGKYQVSNELRLIIDEVTDLSLTLSKLLLVHTNDIDRDLTFGRGIY